MLNIPSYVHAVQVLFGVQIKSFLMYSFVSTLGESVTQCLVKHVACLNTERWSTERIK